MKKFLGFLFIIQIFAQTASACASFIADGKNIRAGGMVKHFFSQLNEPQNLIIKNETNEVCRIRLQALDILPKLDGTYRYVEFEPGRVLYRSLADGLSIVNENGREMLWEEVEMAPNAIINSRLGFNSNQLLDGTSFVAVRAFFPDFSSALTISEIYFSKNYSLPKLAVDGLSFDKTKGLINYTLKGKGDSYTFVQFELKIIDPETGFEMSGYKDVDGNFLKFIAYIKNYWFPGNNDERIIKNAFTIKNFSEIFKKNYLKQYPNADMDKKKFVLYIDTRYGIDIEGWKNHKYLSLSAKTVEITIH